VRSLDFLNTQPLASLGEHIIQSMPEWEFSCVVHDFPTEDNQALLELGRALGTLSADMPLPQHPLEDDFIFRVEALTTPCRDELGAKILSTTEDEFRPHSDGSARPNPYSYVLLLCVEPAIDGGESFVFSSREAVCEISPADADLLRAPVYSWGGDPRPILEGDPARPDVRYNSNGLSIMADAPQHRMYSAALQRWDDTVSRLAARNTFKLSRGDCLIIDNRRVLHGRSAFRGERLMKRLRTT
jgi:alpha-ketoglutarate-dependent taurine dioxygenase